MSTRRLARKPRHSTFPLAHPNASLPLSPLVPTPSAAGTATTAARPPPSVASTEDTIVGGPERLSATPQKGTKRAREEDDDDAAAASPERAAVRQRGASYEPPKGDAPGFLDWLTQPIRNFLKGFREGLAGAEEALESEAAAAAAE